VRLLPEVRRHGVVPALELPHHGGVAAVPLLRAQTVTPAEARALFPVLARRAYLNAGSVGPLSRNTLEAIEAAEALGLERGRGAVSTFERAQEAQQQLRERVGALIGVAAENVVLTTSTTEGCNIVITGLRLEPEDEVVTTDGEHPGLEMPLLASGATVKKARVLERPAAEALDAILELVSPRTRLIALSHVLWLNGHVMPLADIKRETGLPVLVDGAQSVGAIVVDASVADWYTVSGQKWLCGPETIGALYVADHTRLRPRMQGFAATKPESAGRLGVTHLGPPMIAGLIAAIEDRPDWALERAAEMVAVCRTSLLDAGVEVRTEAGQGTLISFRIPGEPPEIVEQAEAEDIIIRNLPDGWLRASVGWWNDRSDIDRLVAFLVRAASTAA
jgi:L-cysteine/cystine lyase